MEHELVGPFLNALERREIIGTVPPVPNTILTDYWKLIQQRFSNPTIADTIARICFDGLNRQPKFIVPVANDILAGSSSSSSKVDGLALVSALWCRYCQGTTESGKVIAPNDPEWDKLTKLAMEVKQSKNPILWLTTLEDCYGA